MSQERESIICRIMFIWYPYILILQAYWSSILLPVGVLMSMYTDAAIEATNAGLRCATGWICAAQPRSRQGMHLGTFCGLRETSGRRGGVFRPVSEMLMAISLSDGALYNPS